MIIVVGFYLLHENTDNILTHQCSLLSQNLELMQNQTFYKQYMYKNACRKASTRKGVISALEKIMNLASTLCKSTTGRYWPVRYPDGSIKVRFRFI